MKRIIEKVKHHLIIECNNKALQLFNKESSQILHQLKNNNKINRKNNNNNNSCNNNKVQKKTQKRIQIKINLKKKKVYFQNCS